MLFSLRQYPEFLLICSINRRIIRHYEKLDLCTRMDFGCFASGSVMHNRSLKMCKFNPVREANGNESSGLNIAIKTLIKVKTFCRVYLTNVDDRAGGHSLMWMKKHPPVCTKVRKSSLPCICENMHAWADSIKPQRSSLVLSRLFFWLHDKKNLKLK